MSQKAKPLLGNVRCNVSYYLNIGRDDSDDYNNGESSGEDYYE